MSFRDVVSILAPIAGALVAAAGGHARADVNNTARVTISPSFSGGNGPIDIIVTQPGTIDVSGSTTGGFSSSGSGSSHVEYGFGHVTGQDFGSIGGTSTSSMRDAITITAPGVPTGTVGTLRFTVICEGTLSAPAGSSAARWTVRADVGGGQWDLGKDGSMYSPDLGGFFQGDAFGTYSATVTFQFGKSMPLGIDFAVNPGAGNSASGPGSASADATIHWGGIDEVKVGGSPVGTFNVSSESGTDWTGYIQGACPADFDGSGFVDLDDFGGFVAAFEAGTDDADFDQSGFVDLDDFGAFVHAFEEGC